MSREFEDAEHTRFLRFGRFDDEDGPVISSAAFTLYSAGLVHSIEQGDPGFIPDDYLEAISAETDLTATELCMAGLWERIDGGYRCPEEGFVEKAAAMMERMARLDDEGNS